jgi:8-oxo-dGTP pyrophosphatase MutT (NUDIX family)
VIASFLRSAAALALAGLLAACAVSPGAPISDVRFAPTVMPRGLARSNQDLAEDFLDLTFALESGDKLPHLLRYEGPIRVHLAPGLGRYRDDVETLLRRLREEAGLDIASTPDTKAAQLHIEAVTADELARVFPSAACFIVPGETNWRDFLRRRPDSRARWSVQSELTGAAIFVPSDTTPQDVRDCLHEEITQALGPANDLYRLPDTIWNDDNLHGVATPFDMLILRVLYQPELHSGMTRAQAAAILPKVFARENPQGRGLPRRARHQESRAWASAIEVALNRREGRAERLASARLAAQIAAEMRPVDHRLAVSLLTLGRLTLRQDPSASARYFTEAYMISRRAQPQDDIRTAHAGVHVAAVALAAGQYDDTILLAERHAPAAIRGQNAILLAGLRSLQAEALLGLGEAEKARAARLDSLRWARYGFGDADGSLAREQAALDATLRVEDK